MTQGFQASSIAEAVKDCQVKTPDGAEGGRRGRLAGMSLQVPRETPMLLGHIIFVWCSGASTSKTLNRKFHENSIHESSTTCHEASNLTCIIDVSMMLYCRGHCHRSG